jgi:peptidoglycan/xylan/chitin deacetylase (PgdA/CDA1 family)
MWPAEHRRRWLPVLLYHRVAPRPAFDPYGNFISPETFESHLRWLRVWGYRSVRLSSVADALAGEAALPRRAVAITFDDGYLDTYQYAFPLLRRHAFDATVFLVTDAVGGDSSFDARAGYEPARMLAWDHVQEMSASGVQFGSHSCSHPQTLVELGDARLRDEVERSRRVLEAQIDARVDLFAYPHSRRDGRVEAVVAEAGYRLACAGVGTRFDPLCVCRVAPPSVGGPAVDLVATWRRLKWRGRSVFGGPSRTRA